MRRQPDNGNMKQEMLITRLTAVFSIAALLGCAGVLYRHMAPRKQSSPDGQYVLTTFVERDPARALHYLCVGLRVTDASGVVVWEHRTRTPAREPYESGWHESSRRVWLASGNTREEFEPFTKK